MTKTVVHVGSHLLFFHTPVVPTTCLSPGLCDEEGQKRFCTMIVISGVTSCTLSTVPDISPLVLWTRWKKISVNICHQWAGGDR